MLAGTATRGEMRKAGKWALLNLTFPAHLVYAGICAVCFGESMLYNPQSPCDVEVTPFLMGMQCSFI